MASRLLILVQRWFHRAPDPRAQNDTPPLIVEITADDLAQGKRKSPWFSALALACNRQFGGQWCLQPPIGWQVFRHTQEGIRHPIRIGLCMSVEAIALEEAWDRGDEVVPQTIVLNDPARNARQT